MAEPQSEVEEEAEEGDAPPPPEKRFRFADVMVEVADGDVANATVLSLPDRGYTELESLESLKCMKRLELRGNHLQKLDFVEMNHELCWLGLARNRLQKLSFLGNLYNLAVLDVSDNRISRMQGLEGLTSLKAFIAARNRISRLEGLLPKRHKQLETLVLAGNRLSEVKLSGFGRLKKASLSQNGLHAFPLLEGLPQLAELRLNGNKLTSLPGAVLGKLPSLHTVDLGNNLLNSQEQLSPLLGLRKLKNLNLQGNSAEPDEAVLKSLAGLEILNNRRLVAKEKGKRKGAAAKPKEERVSVHGRAFQGQKTLLDDEDDEDEDDAAAAEEGPKKGGRKEKAGAGKSTREASWSWNDASWSGGDSWQGSSWSGAGWNEASSWSWKEAAGKDEAATSLKKKGRKLATAEPSKKEAASKESGGAAPAKKKRKAAAAGPSEASKEAAAPLKRKKRKAASAESGPAKRRREAAGPAGAEPAKKGRSLAKKRAQ